MRTENFFGSLTNLLKNKNIIRVTIVFVLYYVSCYISTPFYGTYQIGELGLSLTFISAIVMCGSMSRVFVSKFWGRYADKKFFAAMIEKCFIFLGLAQLCAVLAVPQTGKVMFVLYYVFHGIALGGILEHVVLEDRKVISAKSGTNHYLPPNRHVTI